MFILKLLLKVILLPVFLIVCFIRTWVEVLSKIGCVILGLFYLAMLVIIIMYVSKQMWGAVAISLGMAFGGFLLAFSAVAVGMVLEGIGDGLSKIISM